MNCKFYLQLALVFFLATTFLKPVSAVVQVGPGGQVVFSNLQGSLSFYQTSYLDSIQVSNYRMALNLTGTLALNTNSRVNITATPTGGQSMEVTVVDLTERVEVVAGSVKSSVWFAGNSTLVVYSSTSAHWFQIGPTAAATFSTSGVSADATGTVLTIDSTTSTSSSVSVVTGTVTSGTVTYSYTSRQYSVPTTTQQPSPVQKAISQLDPSGTINNILNNTSTAVEGFVNHFLTFMGTSFWSSVDIFVANLNSRVVGEISFILTSLSTWLMETNFLFNLPNYVWVAVAVLVYFYARKRS